MIDKTFNKLLRVLLLLVSIYHLIFIFSYLNCVGFEVPAYFSDFRAFKIGTQIFLNDPQLLYDINQQTNVYKKIISLSPFAHSDLIFMPYVYPPILNLLIWPLEQFDYVNSYVIFLILAVISILFSVLLILKNTSFSFINFLFTFSCVLSFIFPHSIIKGQVSIVGFLISTIVLFLISKKNNFTAGFAASLLVYKPPLFAYFLFCLLIVGTAQLRFGFLLGLGFILILSTFYLGINWPISYLQISSNYNYGKTYLSSIDFVPRGGLGFYQQYYLLFYDNQTLKWLLYFSTCLPLWLFIIKELKLHKNNLSDKSVFLVLCISLIVSVVTSIHAISYDIIIIIAPLLYIFFNYLNEEQKKEFIIMSILSYIIMRMPDPTVFINAILLHLILTTCWLLLCLRWYKSKRKLKEL